MSLPRTYFNPVQHSPLRQVPVLLSPRCRRATCAGEACPSWRQCEPHTPCGGYRSQLASAETPLARTFVMAHPALSA